MANIKLLTKLYQALSNRDWTAAETVALEIAKSEDRIGHHAAAQRLRGALHPNGRADHGQRGERAQQNKVAGSDYFLSSALNPVAVDRSLNDIRLKPTTRKALGSVVKEWTCQEALADQNLDRRAKLLLHGPPGCGKSVTARALGNELGLPVYVVRFDAVVGAYLGQTALHLRQLFQFAETTPCVLLIDEIDALGKKRGNPLDVGELDRVVIALLQELEHSQPSGLLVATSNIARQLDDALWRRFDLVIELPSPNKSEREAFALVCVKTYGIKLTKRLRDAVVKAKSFAEIERLVESEVRNKILKDL